VYLTGFADEAADDIDGQIRATKELGWKHIEARGVHGETIHDLPDAEFDSVCEKLAAAGVQVNCLGSSIANWGKSITAPFQETLDVVDRSIPRMHKLGAKLVRIMSYAIIQDRPPDDQMAEERFRRLREIVRRFGDAGITVVHENCMNYGGMGWPFTLELLENVPGLKLVFDTGNPVGTPDYRGPDPHARQSSWDFYRHVKDHIAYIHIKDGRFVRDIPGATFPEAEYVWPGEGDGDVKRVVKDLLDSGYDGGFSMEPHLTVVFHDPSVQTQADARFASYLEYGRRFMKLLADVGHATKLPAS
jgi:sugar phosphate isomerase/epimerase